MSSAPVIGWYGVSSKMGKNFAQRGEFSAKQKKVLAHKYRNKNKVS